MKNFQKLILLAFLIVRFAANAQQIANNTTLSNFSYLCEGMQTTFTYNAQNTTACSNGKASLFYVFKARNSVNYANLFAVSGAVQQVSLTGPFDNISQLINQSLQGTGALISNGNSIGSFVNLSANLIQHKYYLIKVQLTNCQGTITANVPSDVLAYCNERDVIDPCENCLSGFEPEIGTYVISAWVKEKNALPAQTTYSNASIAINNYNYLKTCLPQGQIIDGWQRIEDTLKVVQHGKLKLLLKGGLNGAYFDDIRIYPTDGSAITYVYDPLTLRLMAELDERNYAKLYEYDEEGKLIRVKKETEKGIMTIQENRENSSKND